MTDQKYTAYVILIQYYDIGDMQHSTHSGYVDAAVDPDTDCRRDCREDYWSVSFPVMLDCYSNVALPGTCHLSHQDRERSVIDNVTWSHSI